jgi:site-specific DNA-methyltransferase (adenine-specific)
MGRDADEGAGVRARPRVRNTHPTVKPLALMRWLVRLVTPPDGVVLDPFTGSGSTGCAAVLEGVAFVGVERDERFAAIARRRIAAWAELPPGTDPERVLAVENDRRRSLEDAEERRRALASAGQLDLLASGGG